MAGEPLVSNAVQVRDIKTTEIVVCEAVQQWTKGELETVKSRDGLYRYNESHSNAIDFQSTNILYL